MLSNNLKMQTTQASARKWGALAKLVVRKVAILAVVTMVFGWLYAWASPWAYPPDRAAGFGYGLLHGALMPLSLPSLVIGRDVRIYDDNNRGRIYKIGYICGVNICGLVFIGPLFYRPRAVTSTSSGKSG
jgi:hypothetical protein